MSASLRTLIEQVDTRLTPDDRSRLETLVATFMATPGSALDFTAEELRHLSSVEREPFEPAGARDLSALLGRRG